MFPITSTVAILVVCYKSVVALPARPVNLPPFIRLGWVFLGLIVVAVLSRSGPAAWLRKAGDVLATTDAGPAESRPAPSAGRAVMCDAAGPAVSGEAAGDTQ